MFSPYAYLFLKLSNASLDHVLKDDPFLLLPNVKQQSNQSNRDKIDNTQVSLIVAGRLLCGKPHLTFARRLNCVDCVFSTMCFGSVA